MLQNTEAIISLILFSHQFSDSSIIFPPIFYQFLCQLYDIVVRFELYAQFSDRFCGSYMNSRSILIKLKTKFKTN